MSVTSQSTNGLSEDISDENPYDSDAEITSSTTPDSDSVVSSIEKDDLSDVALSPRDALSDDGNTASEYETENENETVSIGNANSPYRNELDSSTPPYLSAPTPGAEWQSHDDNTYEYGYEATAVSSPYRSERGASTQPYESAPTPGSWQPDDDDSLYAYVNEAAATRSPSLSERDTSTTPQDESTSTPGAWESETEDDDWQIPETAPLSYEDRKARIFRILDLGNNTVLQPDLRDDCRMAPVLSVAIEPWLDPSLSAEEHKKFVGKFLELETAEFADAFGAFIYMADGITDCLSDRSSFEPQIRGVLEIVYKENKDREIAREGISDFTMQVFLHANGALNVCQDALSVGLKDIKEIIRLKKGESLKKTYPLFQFERETYIEYLKNKIVHFKSIQLGADGKKTNEKVQVQLFYDVHLGQRYGLSNTPRTMAHEEFAKEVIGLTDEDIDNAKSIINHYLKSAQVQPHIDPHDEQSIAARRRRNAEITKELKEGLRTIHFKWILNIEDFLTRVIKHDKRFDLLKITMEQQFDLPSKLLKAPTGIHLIKRAIDIKESIKMLSSFERIVSLALSQETNTPDKKKQKTELTALLMWAYIERRQNEYRLRNPQNFMNELAAIRPVKQPSELIELIDEASKVLQRSDRRGLTVGEKEILTFTEFLIQPQSAWRKHLASNFLEKFSHENRAYSSLKAIAACIYNAIPDNAPTDEAEKKNYQQLWANHQQALNAYAASSNSPLRIYMQITSEFASIVSIMRDYATKKKMDVTSFNCEPLGMSSRPVGTKYTFVGNNNGISCLKIEGGGSPTFVPIETQKLHQALSISMGHAIQGTFTLPIKDGKLVIANLHDQVNPLKRKAEENQLSKPLAKRR